MEMTNDFYECYKTIIYHHSQSIRKQVEKNKDISKIKKSKSYKGLEFLLKDKTDEYFDLIIKMFKEDLRFLKLKKLIDD